MYDSTCIHVHVYILTVHDVHGLWDFPKLPDQRRYSHYLRGNFLPFSGKQVCDFLSFKNLFFNLFIV